MFQSLKAKLFSLGANDFVKAFIVAVLTPVATLVGQALDAFGTGQPFVLDWSNLWHVALAAGVGYLIKQFLTNSNGEFLSAEPKVYYPQSVPPQAK